MAHASLGDVSKIVNALATSIVTTTTTLKFVEHPCEPICIYMEDYMTVIRMVCKGVDPDIKTLGRTVEERMEALELDPSKFSHLSLTMVKGVEAYQKLLTMDEARNYLTYIKKFVYDYAKNNSRDGTWCGVERQFSPFIYRYRHVDSKEYEWRVQGEVEKELRKFNLVKIYGDLWMDKVFLHLCDEEQYDCATVCRAALYEICRVCTHRFAEEFKWSQPTMEQRHIKCQTAPKIREVVKVWGLTSIVELSKALYERDLTKVYTKCFEVPQLMDPCFKPEYLKITSTHTVPETFICVPKDAIVVGVMSCSNTAVYIYQSHFLLLKRHICGRACCVHIHNGARTVSVIQDAVMYACLQTSTATLQISKATVDEILCGGHTEFQNISTVQYGIPERETDFHQSDFRDRRSAALSMRLQEENLCMCIYCEKIAINWAGVCQSGHFACAECIAFNKMDMCHCGKPLYVSAVLFRTLLLNLTQREPHRVMEGTLTNEWFTQFYDEQVTPVETFNSLMYTVGMTHGVTASEEQYRQYNFLETSAWMHMLMNGETKGLVMFILTIMDETGCLHSLRFQTKTVENRKVMYTYVPLGINVPPEYRMYAVCLDARMIMCLDEDDMDIVLVGLGGSSDDTVPGTTVPKCGLHGYITYYSVRGACAAIDARELVVIDCVAYPNFYFPLENARRFMTVNEVEKVPIIDIVYPFCTRKHQLNPELLQDMEFTLNRQQPATYNVLGNKKILSHHLAHILEQRLMCYLYCRICGKDMVHSTDLLMYVTKMHAACMKCSTNIINVFQPTEQGELCNVAILSVMKTLIASLAARELVIPPPPKPETNARTNNGNRRQRRQRSSSLQPSI